MRFSIPKFHNTMTVDYKITRTKLGCPIFQRGSFQPHCYILVSLLASIIFDAKAKDHTETTPFRFLDLILRANVWTVHTALRNSFQLLFHDSVKRVSFCMGFYSEKPIFQY